MRVFFHQCSSRCWWNILGMEQSLTFVFVHSEERAQTERPGNCDSNWGSGLCPIDNKTEMQQPSLPRPWGFLQRQRVGAGSRPLPWFNRSSSNTGQFLLHRIYLSHHPLPKNPRIIPRLNDSWAPGPCLALGSTWPGPFSWRGQRTAFLPQVLMSAAE